MKYNISAKLPAKRQSILQTSKVLEYCKKIRNIIYLNPCDKASAKKGPVGRTPDTISGTKTGGGTTMNPSTPTATPVNIRCVLL